MKEKLISATKQQVPQLGSEFCRPQKTMVPIDDFWFDCNFIVHHRDYVRLERVTYGMSLLALALAVVADVNSEL